MIHDSMADCCRVWLTIAATALTIIGGLFGPVVNHRVTRLPHRDIDGKQ